jgi:hypothetical protein
MGRQGVGVRHAAAVLAVGTAAADATEPGSRHASKGRRQARTANLGRYKAVAGSTATSRTAARGGARQCQSWRGKREAKEPTRAAEHSPLLVENVVVIVVATTS